MTTHAQLDFIPPLIDLVKAGDLRWGEAVEMFRNEFNCSISYVLQLGLVEALKRAQDQVIGGK